jgi:hypothetical protein
MERLLHKLLNLRESNTLHPETVHGLAQQIRDRTLDALDFGVIASETQLPHQLSDKTIRLPFLLRYSSQLISHMNNLRSILANPHEFELTTSQGGNWGCDKLAYNIVYESAGLDHIYYFNHPLLADTTASLEASPNSIFENEPFIDVAIVNVGEKKRHGFWLTSYRYSVYDSISPRNISGSDLQPEKSMLLNFWFSPKRLTGKQIQDYFYLSAHTRRYIEFLETKDQQGFRYHLYRHKAALHANSFQKFKSHWAEEPRVINSLLRKGDRDFTVVEIGTIDLAGQNYYIYTGSEQSGINESLFQTNSVASLKPARIPINNR